MLGIVGCFSPLLDCGVRALDGAGASLFFEASALAGAGCPAAGGVTTLDTSSTMGASALAGAG